MPDVVLKWIPSLNLTAHNEASIIDGLYIGLKDRSLFNVTRRTNGLPT